MPQVAVRSSDRVIEMIGEKIGQRTACVTEDVSDPTYAQIKAALAQPNGGVTLSPDHATVTPRPPSPLPGPTAQDVAKSDLQANADSMIGRIGDIISNGATYTNVQVRDAVIDLARAQLRLLKFIRYF